MGAVAKQPRRPRGSGSIQWRHGRPYAVFRDLITGKPKWEGFDSEDEADAFLTQWAADKKAAKLAARAAHAEHEARAPRRRPSSSSRSWTFGEVLTDWEEGIATVFRTRRCATTVRVSTTCARRSVACLLDR